jgi:ArsR family transcriptional regulator
MAHPTRLAILDVLSHGEACVCHLTALLEQRQPYISQQLMTLREGGLVRDRRDGNIVYYRLSEPRLAQAIALTREILTASGVEVRRVAVPDGPVPGCPCPRCTQANTLTQS